MRTTFGLLGDVAINIDEVDVPLGPPMVRALLAALLLGANHYLSIDRLISSLWDAPPASAGANLRKYATDLRRALNYGSVPIPACLVARRGGGYRLSRRPLDLDLDRFSELSRRGHLHLAAGEYGSAANTLTEALRLWRGDAGYDVPPNSPIARQLCELNDRRRAAVADLTDARLALGESTSLLPSLRSEVADRPLDERAAGQLIRALHRAGDPAAALEAYGRLRSCLASELGVAPSAGLQSLQLAVLNREDHHAVR
jgi:DNA-binding SARP family transcriptional activator